MEHSSFRDELNHYKEQIDIRDYLEQSGYTIDKSRDTPHYRAYSNHEIGDKVYIPKNSRYGIPNYYVNQFDNDDKGTIVDFIMTREKKTLDETRLTLRDFQQGYVPQKAVQAQSLPEDENRKKRQQYIVEKIATTNPSALDELYMEKRLLSAATRHHPAFEGKVQLNEVADKKWIVFPLEDTHGKPTGLSMKTEGKERILGEKSGVWISNPTKEKAKVDKLIITEHPIDAMSYHQLHGVSQEKHNIIYLSTAGNPSQRQMDVIEQKAVTLQPEEIVLANDNDRAGHQYNEKYEEKLKDTEIQITIEKPQFKDWNADVKATVLYQTRLLSQAIEDPQQTPQEDKIKADATLEDMLFHKKYDQINGNQQQQLPSYYVERTIEGKKVEFTLKEMAFINKDQKLEALMEETQHVTEVNQSFVARKTQVVEESAVQNINQEKSIHQPEHLHTSERISNLQAQSIRGKEAFQDADDHIKKQESKSIMPEQVHDPLIKHDLGQADEFIETQKRYNRQIDDLQQQLSNTSSHQEMSRKLYYYKNYPHLNDQEVETYISIEDKMQSKQQGHTQNLGKQQDKEIGI